MIEENPQYLIGQRFGKLTVTGFKGRTTDSRKVWICDCDCGTKNVEVTESHLKGGGTRSCGCLKREMPKEVIEEHYNRVTKKMIGKKFGHLTVIGFSRFSSRDAKNYQRYWRCKCDCGNEIEVVEQALISGNTKSCGHIRKPDLTGKRFGYLTVLGLAKGKISKKYRVWHCRCDCGNEIDVRTNLLTSENTKSCGCLISQRGRR